MERERAAAMSCSVAHHPSKVETLAMARRRESKRASQRQVEAHVPQGPFDRLQLFGRALTEVLSLQLLETAGRFGLLRNPDLRRLRAGALGHEGRQRVAQGGQTVIAGGPRRAPAPPAPAGPPPK